MIEILVCVGSSCHINGSAYLISSLQDLLKKKHLERQVTLKASFCMGECNTRGVCMKIDGEKVEGVTLDNLHSILEESVLERLKK